MVSSPVTQLFENARHDAGPSNTDLLRSIKDVPAGADAIVAISKLRDYCLDPLHPRGRHKARVFLSALSLGHADADVLRAALLEAAREGDAAPGEADEYGDRYTVDFLITRGNREAKVRSAWIILRGESAPRLTSCFVLLD